MLISFLKSDNPHCLINTQQIVACYCSMYSYSFPNNLPPYVKCKRADAPICKVEANGRVYIKEVAESQMKKTSKEVLYGSWSSGKEKKFFVDGVVKEIDVALCSVELTLSGTGCSNDGSCALCKVFNFEGIQDCLNALTALEEAMGIQNIK